MKTFPTPYNPQCAPETPGYRILGGGEVLKKTDEVWDGREWSFTICVGESIREDCVTSCSYRRALNVDDPYVPPPEQWNDSRWEVFHPGSKVLTENNWQVWCPGVNAPDGGCAWHDTRAGKLCFDYYFRRPTNPSMNTITITPPAEGKYQLAVNWISLKDRYPTDEEAKAGLWTWNPSPTSPNGGYAQSAKWADAEGFKNCRGYATHFAPIVWPQPPKNLLPPAPEVNGYKGSYTKDGDIVTFGCAKLSVPMLREVAAAMGFVAPKEGIMENAGRLYAGNRNITSVTLSSGVSLSSEQIKAILNYVGEVNKGS